MTHQTRPYPVKVPAWDLVPHSSEPYTIEPWRRPAPLRRPAKKPILPALHAVLVLALWAAILKAVYLAFFH